MTALLVVSVADDAELDRLTLDDEGRIAYRTGAARDMVEAWRRRLADGPGDAGDAGDDELLDALTGWSNGYVAIRPADQPAGGEDQADEADQDDAGGESADAPDGG